MTTTHQQLATWMYTTLAALSTRLCKKDNPEDRRTLALLTLLFLGNKQAEERRGWFLARAAAISHVSAPYYLFYLIALLCPLVTGELDTSPVTQSLCDSHLTALSDATGSVLAMIREDDRIHDLNQSTSFASTTAVIQ